MRIRGAKTELESAGLETDGMVESTAKLREEILALSGVDIMENANEFKSTYKIMDELAAKWEDLTDIQQASITELIAGKRQGNIISSMMSNFDTAREALETSLNSSGSAMEEHAKWSESLDARLLKLKATWQSLAQSFMSSNFLKGSLDGIIALVNGVDKLISTLGTVPTLLGGFSLFKGISKIFNAKKTLNLVGGISSIGDVLNILNAAFPKASAGASKFAAALKGMSASGGIAKGAITGLFGAIAAHPIIAAAVVAVTALTAAFTYQKKKAEELAKTVEETVSSYKEQHSELIKLKNDYDTSNEDSMISKYGELSKGVDGLGRNVSLTADEYSEYQSIVNSIAEQIPSLISGYDEQGNAILSCKGNVEELTEAYEKLIHAQNNEVLSKAGDIEKDFTNTLKESGREGFWNQNTTTEDIEALEHIYKNGLKTKEEITEYLKDELGSTNMINMAGIAAAMEDAGVDGADWTWGTYKSNIDALAEQLEEDPSKIKGIIDNYYAQFEDAVEEQKTIAQAKLSEAFDVSSAISGLNYGNIGEDLQAVAYQVVNSFDYEFLSDLSEKGKSLESWVTEMLNQLNAIGEADNAQIEAAFDLQTQFNGGEISYGDYVKSLKDVESTIDGLNLKSEAKTQLKISLGLDDDGVIEQYETLVSRLTDSKNYDFDISENEARRFLDGLSSEEFAIAVDVITEMSNNNVNETIDQVRNAIERELAIQGLTLELTIETETAKLESLTTAITESFSGSGLSSESLSAVEGMFSGLSSYDPSKLFERTANGIRLNSDELRRLNSEYKNTNLAKVNKELDSLGDIYNQTRQELYGLTYGTDEYNDKAGDLRDIEARIKAAEQLAAQYSGLSSAYQEWQMVESAGSQRDMYENLIKGLENVDDEISRGWYDDGTIELLELLTGKDLSTAGIEEVKKAYKGLGKEIENTSYSVRDFFTVDDDGNSTNAGVYNFLDAIGQLEEEAFGGKDVVQRKDGKIVGFDFQIVGGDEVIAEALGISEELVQIMVRAADDAGFVVSMDGTYQQLDVLKEKAQEAAESLNRTLEKSGKKGFDFNFNTSNVDDIKKQLTEAQKILDTFRNTDGTINTKLEGADEALTVASTLQSMLDKLTRPAYMEIEVSQVEDELQEPLRNLHELQRLTETEHQLKLTGADTSELEKSKQEIYEYFEGLDSDVKVKLGLVDENGNPLTGQSLKDKLNSGDIAIEATVDIQMKMDDKLGILVDKALLDAGIIDGKEFEKRVNIYLNADVNNEDAKNKTEQAVNEVTGSNGNGSANGKTSDGKVDKNVDVEVKAGKVDTSDVKDKTEEAVKDESAEKLAVETTVELETTIDEALDLIDKFEDKDITIDVKVKGLDDVKELSKNIDLATKIKGNVDNLSEYVEGAKVLSELDDNIASFVTAEVKGNVLEKSKKELQRLGEFAEHAKTLQGSSSKQVDITANIKGNVIDIKERKIDNLKTFVDSAKGIKNIEGNIVSNITANTLGSVFEDKEKDIDNLDVFIESAKGIKDIEGDIVSNITANTLGSVFEDKEKTIDNLDVFIESAKGIKDIEGDIVSNITANTLGSVFEGKERKIDNLKTFIESANGIREIEGNIVSNITANTLGSVFEDKEKDIDNIKTFIESAKGIKDIEGNIVSNITANTLGNVFENKERKTDNLDVFIDSAKGIKEIEGNIVSNITANTLGSVFEDAEREIDNLDVFIDSAKGIKEIEGNIVSNITANVNGNVVGDKTEAKINNLEVFADGAKELQSIESKTVNITANINGNVPDKTEGYLDDLQVFADGAKDLQNVASKTVNITANINGNVPTYSEGYLDDLQVFAKGANALQNTASKTVNIEANANGNVISGEGASGRLTSLTEFKSLVEGMSNQTVAISVTANVDSEKINSAIDLLTRAANSGVFKDYSATVQVGATIATIDDAVVQNYKAPKKDGKVAYTVDSSVVDSWTAPPKKGVVNYSASVEALTEAQKHKTGTITYKANIIGLGGVAQGTAHANGTTSGRAFAQGNWGIKENGIALGGELGTEVVVRNGKWFTVGDEGAEFFRYKKNDIVFNAAQTESLFKYGGIKGANPRGKMLANGTAFSEGNAFAGSSGTGGAGKVSGNAVTGKTYGSKDSDSSSDKDFEEVIDWIEVIIDRVERAIDKFEQQANNIYKSWSSRNKALLNQISEVQNEIGIQQQAYDKYMDAAEAVGLKSSYAKKVREGKIDIQTIKNEKLAEKIKDYQQWYEKALDCEKAIEELKETEASLYAQRFENIQTQYDSILQGYEHTEAMLNEYISQAEERGHIVSKKYYDALIDNEKSNIDELKREQADLITERDNAVAEGKITKGSEAWYEQCAAIDEVTQAIEESTTAILEYDNAIREIDWSIFDLIQERISGITEEADFLIELMSNKDLFDDDGKLTSQGLATMALHAQNYNTHMYAADEYGAEVTELNRQIAEDPYNQELINRRNELLELQRESILAAEDEKNAIRDMVEEGINFELDALQELIDKKNEALDSERDLYEYQKKVKEQTSEIASLEKQMAAYSGDDSEEAKQKIQQIKVDLETARQDLQETEYDKFVDDTSSMLDTLYNEYELILNTRLDNIDYLLESVIESINAAASADGNIMTALGSDGAISIAVSNNATSIRDTLTSETNKVGITLSNAMNSIWNTGEGNAKSVLTMYGEDFRTKSATIITTLNGIKTSVNSMVASLNKEAEKKTTANKTTTSAKKNPTTTSSTNKTTTKKTTPKKSGDGTPKIGDRVKYVSGQYYYDSQGKKPLGSYKKGEYVYITNINKRDWATHGYHISTGNKLGKGDLGWLKLNQLSGYASGKKNFLDDEVAWTQENGLEEYIVRPSDGAILTPIARKGSVLNAQASDNLWNMTNSPTEFIKDNLGLGSANVPSVQNVNNSYTQRIDNVVFRMDNVKNYEEMLSAMQKDKNFERLVMSMSIDQIAGKSKLAKGKSIR